MTATDELRRMLDERGVEWHDTSDENVRHTTWDYTHCWFNEFADGWTAWGEARAGTPEQAIEATLGRGTCHIKDGKCDQCGAIIRDKAVTFLTPTRQGIRMVEKYDASYCPNCGRRVVAGDGE